MQFARDGRQACRLPPPSFWAAVAFIRFESGSLWEWNLELIRFGYAE